jgi:hypothetical protein
VNPREIKKLLVEASLPTCEPVRLHKIALSLAEAIQPDVEKADPEDFHHDTLRSFVGALFFETARNRRDLLPTLYPAFAMICGESVPNHWMCSVDWTIAIAE